MSRQPLNRKFCPICGLLLRRNDAVFEITPKVIWANPRGRHRPHFVHYYRGYQHEARSYRQIWAHISCLPKPVRNIANREFQAQNSDMNLIWTQFRE
jgi:hypothetical protein